MDFLSAVKHLQNKECECILLPIPIGRVGSTSLDSDITKQRYFMICLLGSALSFKGFLYADGTIVERPGGPISSLRINTEAILATDWELYKATIIIEQPKPKEEVERRIKIKKD